MRTTLFVPLIAALALGSAAQANPGHHKVQQLLNFRTMYAVDGAFIGEANPVRDVIGDELPWEIGRVSGSLDTAGHLLIFVRGLVFADDPSVPEELRGKNDEEQFRGLVSCLVAEEGVVETVNIVTNGFKADTKGNSVIHQKIELPSECIAPIVMVLAGSEDKWFAMTGFEGEEDSD